MSTEANLLTLPDGSNTLEVKIQFNASDIVCDTGAEKITFTQGKLSQAHKAAGAYILNFGVFPYHCLRIRNPEDQQMLLKSWSKLPEIKALGRNNKRYFLLLTLSGVFLFAGFALFTYFSVLPAFSGYVAQKISMETERELGLKLLEGVKQQYKINDSLTMHTKDFFHSLGFPGAEKIELMVVESNDTNAFAMPGGFLVVFKGILHKTKSEDQLSALLAHEYAHVRYRHSLRNMINASAGGLLISMLAGDISGSAAGLLLSQAHEFRNLSYSRSLETEADEMGMEMMAAAGANPAAMAEMLIQIQPSGKEEIPSFLSTHPVFSERIPHAQNFAVNLRRNEKNRNYALAFERLKKTLSK